MSQQPTDPNTAVVHPPAGSASLRLAVVIALAAAVLAVALGVVAILSDGALAGGAASASLVVAGTAVLAAALVVVTVNLYRARAELARRHAEIEGMASVDALTGLANRRAFECELERHVRPGADLALLLIDLDNLKSINDSVGHLVGDEVLRGTARRIQGCLRTTDIVSRLSGDEFAVLLPRVGDRSNVEVIARRIVESVQRPYPAELHSCTVSASAGVAMLESGAGRGDLLRNADVALMHAKRQGKGRYVCTVSASAGVAMLESGAGRGDLLRNADVALMHAKRQGKGRYVFYRAEIHSSEVERIAFARDLRTALEQTNSSSITSRSWTRRTGRSSASRPWCGGSIPSAAWCPPSTSSPSPRRPG
jgi:diguanylate cyclase (GGDEF)-like protein